MSGDLFQAAAELFAGAEGSRVGSLRRLTKAVAQCVPGCCGASATFWEPAEVVAMAATCPDLTVLAGRQFVAGEGPIIAALRTGEPSVTADTAREDRWPDFAARALAAGVRSSAAIAHQYHSVTLSLSLHGGQAALPGQEPFPLAPLLCEFGAAAMAGAAEHIRMQHTAGQLQEAITSRLVVEEARGVLMQLTGCDADDASDRLQEIAGAQQMRLSEAARLVVETLTEPAGPA